MVSTSKKKLHLWLCDGNGDIYFTSNILGSSSFTNHSESKKSWRRVGDGFDSVAAGHSGLVCAIKNGSLYLRAEVTCRQPAGTSWENCSCDAVTVLVGNRCIVRSTSSGAWYFTRGLLIEGLFDWKAIGLDVDETFSSDTPSLSQYTLDSQDKLYAFTKTNEVALCNLSSKELQWSIVTDSFSPTPSMSSISKLLKLVTGGVLSYSIHYTAAGANNCIWCLTNKGKEIWQLVVSKLESKNMYNWNKFLLPTKRTEEVHMFEASKVWKEVLYFVLKQGRKYRLALLSLGSDASEFVDIAYPSSSWHCKAMATSCMPTIVEEKFCCEDGACSSCTSLKRPLEKEEDLDQRYRTCSDLLPSPKRRKIESHSYLVKGVDVKCNSLNGFKKVSVLLLPCAWLEERSC